MLIFQRTCISNQFDLLNSENISRLLRFSTNNKLGDFTSLSVCTKTKFSSRNPFWWIKYSAKLKEYLLQLCNVYVLSLGLFFEGCLKKR